METENETGPTTDVEEMDDANDEAITPETAVIWEARKFNGEEFGFLVTEPGNVNKPIAFVAQDCDDYTGLQAYNLAIRIADNPEEVWRDTQPIARVDLRACGLHDSPIPMPSFIYAILCWPIDHTLEPRENAPPENSEWADEFQEPRPYCHFMARHMRKGKEAMYGK